MTNHKAILSYNLHSHRLNFLLLLTNSITRHRLLHHRFTQKSQIQPNPNSFTPIVLTHRHQAKSNPNTRTSISSYTFQLIPKPSRLLSSSTPYIYTLNTKRMGSILSSQNTQMSKEVMETSLSKAKELAASSPVFLFSKTYCGYCKRVKDLLKQLGATYKVLELDIESDGGEIQAALAEWTGQRTVPNVFIGGKHIGGCDAVLEKHRAGQLVPLLNDAGAIANNSLQL